jgi:ornithine cyclodeaminase
VTRLRVLSASDIDRAIDMNGAMDVMSAAFGQLAKGRANVPQRLGLKTDTGLVLAMPGNLPDEHALAIKIVTVFPDNTRRSLPSVYGTYLLLDPTTGQPRALLDGTALTLRRTASASALAASYLAREDSAVHLMVGTGALARHLVAAHRAVRPIRETLIWGA